MMAEVVVGLDGLMCHINDVVILECPREDSCIIYWHRHEEGISGHCCKFKKHSPQWST